MTFIDMDMFFLQNLAMWVTLKNRTDVLLADEDVAKNCLLVPSNTGSKRDDILAQGLDERFNQTALH